MIRFNLVGLVFSHGETCRITGGISFRTLGFQFRHVHSFIEMEGEQIRVLGRFGFFKMEKKFLLNDVAAVELKHKFWRLYKITIALKSGLELRLIANGRSEAIRIAESMSAKMRNPPLDDSEHDK